MDGIFISYRRDDSAGYAGRLHESLADRFGADRIFRDVDTLRPGQDFVAAIDRRVSQCTVFLVLIGREWLTASDASGRRRLDLPHDYVRLEIAAALRRPGVVIVPVLVEGAAMPAPEQIPSDIDALARRHAISLRDETWDQDVDRLAAVAADAGVEASSTGQQAVGRPGGVLTPRHRLPLIAALIAALLVISAVRFLLMRQNAAPESTTSSGRSGTSQPESEPHGASAASGPASAIALPPLTEIVHGDLIYTLIAGSIQPHGATSSLRLTIRLSNDGSYDANFWDASFRVVTGSDAIAPTSGLNEVVPGHAQRQAIVTFEAPSAAKRGVLRVGNPDTFGELTLDLSGTGSVSDADSTAAGASSREIVRFVSADPRPLFTAGDVGVVLKRATSRRFANATRLTCEVVVTNRGKYPLFSGDLILRVVDNGSMAPVKTSNAVIDAAADATVEYVFDLPPTTMKVVLRTTGFGQTRDLPLEIR